MTYWPLQNSCHGDRIQQVPWDVLVVKASQRPTVTSHSQNSSFFWPVKIATLPNHAAALKGFLKRGWNTHLCASVKAHVHKENHERRIFGATDSLVRKQKRYQCPVCQHLLPFTGEFILPWTLSPLCCSGYSSRCASISSLQAPPLGSFNWTCRCEIVMSAQVFLSFLVCFLFLFCLFNYISKR